MAATGTPRLSSISTPATPANRGEEGGGKATAAGGEEGSKAGGGSGVAAAGGAGAGAGASASSTDPDAQPLEIHQLAAAASALKVRLQKARQACGRLGDMDRTVDEQQEEIGELEERVSKLRTVLEDMGVGASSSTAAEARAPTAAGGGGDGSNEMVLRDVRPI
ncbi:hypothetical protein SLS58_010284 [Diplodia intermedia]|uniref:Mediator of RNA polymerase II transcription subunit 9 n=1 Tax=Diplodia intermedia TaxID=856260 RepID=A0ABR3T783_9PEZI